MAKHRRASHAPSIAFELPDHELAAISTDLQRRMPSTSSDRVEAAVRRALVVLSGLHTEPQHVSALVTRRAEAALNEVR
jgi:hypothetical protein